MPVDNLTAGSLDLSLSALYTFSPEITNCISNRFGIGLQMQNLFDADLFYSEDLIAEIYKEYLLIDLQDYFPKEFECLVDGIPSNGNIYIKIFTEINGVKIEKDIEVDPSLDWDMLVKYVKNQSDEVVKTIYDLLS